MTAARKDTNMPTRKATRPSVPDPHDICLEVATNLPRLGSELAMSLDAVVDAIAPMISAAQRYDSFVVSAVPKVLKAHATQDASAPLPARPLGVGPSVAASPFSENAEAPTVASPTPDAHPGHRVSVPHRSAPLVDGISVTPSRGASQLAAVVLPALRHLGAPSGLLEGLRQLANDARPLPTE
jgi:hypothetical protein